MVSKFNLQYKRLLNVLTGHFLLKKNLELISSRYYGLWLWFPELFNKLDVYYTDHPNATVSVCEVTDYKPTINTTLLQSVTTTDCTVSNEVFVNSFLISIAALPGNVWTMVHMDKLGRKFFVVLSMVLSGGCVFFIYLVTSKAANLALSCAFGFVSVMGFNALDCLGIELFPTHLRYHYRCSYGLRSFK